MGFFTVGDNLMNEELVSRVKFVSVSCAMCFFQMSRYEGRRSLSFLGPRQTWPFRSCVKPTLTVQAPEYNEVSTQTHDCDPYHRNTTYPRLWGWRTVMFQVFGLYVESVHSLPQDIYRHRTWLHEEPTSHYLVLHN